VRAVVASEAASSRTWTFRPVDRPAALLPRFAPLLSFQQRSGDSGRVLARDRERGAEAEARGDLALVTTTCCRGVHARFFRRAMRVKAVRAAACAKLASRTCVTRRWFSSTPAARARQPARASRIHEVPSTGSRTRTRACTSLDGAPTFAASRPGPRPVGCCVSWPSVSPSTLAYGAPYLVCASRLIATLLRIAIARRRSVTTAANRRLTFGVRWRAGALLLTCSRPSSSWLALGLTSGASRCCTTSSAHRRTSFEAIVLVAASTASTLSRTMPALVVFAERRHAPAAEPPLIALSGRRARGWPLGARSPSGVAARSQHAGHRRPPPTRSARRRAPRRRRSLQRVDLRRQPSSNGDSQGGDERARPFQCRRLRRLTRSRDQVQATPPHRAKPRRCGVCSFRGASVFFTPTRQITIPATIGLQVGVRVGSMRARPTVHRH